MQGQCMNGRSTIGQSTIEISIIRTRYIQYLSLSLSHIHTLSHAHALCRIGFAIEEDRLQWNRQRNLWKKSHKEIFLQSQQFLIFLVYPQIWHQWDCRLHQFPLLIHQWWHHQRNLVHLICLIWAGHWQLIYCQNPKECALNQVRLATTDCVSKRVLERREREPQTWLHPNSQPTRPIQ